jgi:hypothetical protein
MEAMIDTAVHIGIPREMAKIMVANTVRVRNKLIKQLFFSLYFLFVFIFVTSPGKRYLRD